VKFLPFRVLSQKCSDNNSNIIIIIYIIENRVANTSKNKNHVKTMMSVKESMYWSVPVPYSMCRGTGVVEVGLYIKSDW
jgi:hypothetical protein